jgi:hypothetical protein
MKDNIPIVQGYAISSDHGPLVEHGDNYNGCKGEQQPRKFNDVWAAVLFYAQLIVIAVLFPMALQDANNGNNGAGIDLGNVLYFCSITATIAALLATCSLGFMMLFANSLVKIALFFQIGAMLAFAILSLIGGFIWISVLFWLSFAVSCWYAKLVWPRIPFAAANLKTALTAVRANLGLIVVSYVFMAVGFGYTILWMTTANVYMNSAPASAFFLFLSYYWTQQVLSNTVHTSTAGVIGTWWFQPREASSFCSPAIGDSIYRSVTYSFGSICFGSLLVAIVQALRALNHQLRGQDDARLLVCIIDCILACIEGIIEYLNKWAYIYVGLYGYNYLDAGRNVISLFAAKGWSSIITDDLANNVLTMMSFMIASLTGLVGYILASMNNNLLADLGLESPGGTGFLFGFFIGFIFSSLVMSIVSSAVDTVIVCFAEGPAEFDANHPELSANMLNAWRQAWPSDFRM